MITTDNLMPGDVYRDGDGNVWVVEFWCPEPTVCMKRVWDARAFAQPPADEVRKRGGVSGLMWRDFMKIAHAPQPRKPEPLSPFTDNKDWMSA